MIVSIVDPGPLGMLLGSLLHLKGVPVSFQPRTSTPDGGRIRVNLPDSRLLVEGIGAEISDAGTLATSSPSSTFLLVMEDPGGMDREARKRLEGQAGVRDCVNSRIRDCGNSREGVRGAVINGCWDGPERTNSAVGRWETCLVLADPVMLDAACVELPEPGPAILAPRGSQVADLLLPFRSFGFSFHAVEDTGACLNSYRVMRLLDLPVAMCNTTRAHFLSYPEGREIACHVLDEGLRAHRKLGGKLGRLPVGDPSEMLHRIGRTPHAFEEARFLPDRRYNPALQRLMRGGALDPKGHNRRIVERAAGAGLTLDWNWKLSQKLSRVHGAGFFPGPAELLSAIG